MNNEKTQTGLAMQKLAQLEDLAIGRYLDKTDFDATLWLDEAELKDYTTAWELVHGQKLDGSDANIVEAEFMVNDEGVKTECDKCGDDIEDCESFETIDNKTLCAGCEAKRTSVN